MSSHIKEAELPVRCVYFPASAATATRNCQQAKAIWTQAKAGCKCGCSWGLQGGRANHRSSTKIPIQIKKKQAVLPVIICGDFNDADSNDCSSFFIFAMFAVPL